jgi:colanic acid biosynthesis glycosyl transferase WcaI
VHILVVSQYFWPENFRINDLVSEWLERGHQVTVLTGVPNYPTGQVFDHYLTQPSAYADYKGACVVRVPMLARGKGNFRLLLNYLSFALGGMLWGAWQLRGVKADVIFVFEPSPVTVGLPAVLLSKIKNAPIVFWALDLWPETLAAMGVIHSQRLLAGVGKLVRFIYNRCALVLGQSKGFLGSLAKYCSDPLKIRYFPSWAEDVFTHTDVILASEVPVVADAFNVVFAGNIGDAQDMPAVLDAAARLKDRPSIRWIVVGDGRKYEWLKSEVVNRGLQSSFLLVGRFSVERMPSFYAHADALLVPLKRDPVFSMTIPGKVQSYLMAGVPILGMLDGEGAAVIRDANAGITCNAGNSAGLADAVLSLQAMSTNERLQLGKNGKIYAEKEFGRNQLMDRMESFLFEAMTTHELKSSLRSLK